AAVIGLAHSTDLEHWKLDEPALKPADGQAWERGGLYKSYLVRDDGTYYLFYNAKNRTEWPWKEQTGLATSRDLVKWSRCACNPIIANGPKGTPDSLFASDPAVLRYHQTWAAYYFGLADDSKARELLALGADPAHLAKINQPLIDVGPPGTIDERYAHKPA